MPKRSRTHEPDANETAFAVVQRATGQEPPPPDVPLKNPAAVALGRLGGVKGGAARAKGMTAEERAESARKAARARWSPPRGEGSSG